MANRYIERQDELDFAERERRDLIRYEGGKAILHTVEVLGACGAGVFGLALAAVVLQAALPIAVIAGAVMALRSIFGR